MASATGNVHLVGSLGMPDVESGFRLLAEHLGSRAKRYPDGEPGERSYWVRWQNETFARHPDFELQEQRELDGYQDSKTRPLYALREGVDPAGVDIGPLGYADAARESWAIFARLRDEGAIPAGTRFQVCLPTTTALLTTFVNPEVAGQIEPALEAAMRQDVDTIVGEVPSSELAIQWDVAFEVIAHDGGQPPVHYDDVLGGSVARIARHLSWIPAEVEAGIHLCYGDPGHKHIIEPRDLGTCVAFANGICAASPRPVHWIHMPVPRERDDEAYAAPLGDLSLNPETELYVGCVHHTDGVDGTRRRLAAAQAHASGFGVATECGFGRRDPATLPDLCDIHASVADD